jgi:hypothetical protein
LKQHRSKRFLANKRDFFRRATDRIIIRRRYFRSEVEKSRLAEIKEQMDKEIVKPHSMIGILSCVVGIGMFLVFLLANVAYYLQFKQGRGSGSDELGLLQLLVEMVVPIPVHIVGLILAAVSLFFPNRKKMFPVLGVCLNLIFGLCSLFPWIWLVVAGLGRVQ